ncbi:helix-turn-helix domain-containing protein [Secundilactobacillus folii]|uniref:helix-turn-helix domain-containing protein n=1 Tax=Secundilactobacillus folii TaxID=2678357 RepID=UPI003CCDB10F
MSSSEAARRWHKADDYVRQAYRKTPWKFPKGSIRKFGKQLVVTKRGMEVVTGMTEDEAATEQHKFDNGNHRIAQ